MMLQTIRDRATGIVLWVIVVLICLTFALWGVNSYFQGGGKINAAEVNGEEVPMQEFYNQFQQQRMRDEQMLGQRFDPATYDEDQVKKDVIDRMVREELVQQWLDGVDIKIGVDQIRQYIMTNQVFYDESGRFSKERYQQLLQSKGFSEAYFEGFLIRQSLAVGQFRQGLRGTAFITTDDVDRILKLEKQKRKFAYFVVNSRNLEKEVSVSDDEVKAHYDAHKEELMSPEQVKLSYVELNEEVLMPLIEVDEADLKARYEQDLSKFNTAEQRRARHILVRVKPDADAETERQAKKKLELVAGLIKETELTFEDAAKTNSEDPGSAKSGGDLGFFGKGMMVPEFENVVFNMEPGQVSELVKTQFGYHLIKLEEIKAARTKAFDEVKAQLESEIKKEKVENLFIEKKELLANLAYEHSKSLEDVAEKMGLELKTTGFMGRAAGADLFRFPKVREAAFSEDVFEGRYNSDFIKTGNNKGVIVRINEYKPASQLELKKVESRIHRELLTEKARDLAGKKAADLVDQVNQQGGDLAAVADANGLEVTETDLIDRKERKHPLALVKKGFSILTDAKDQQVPVFSVDLPAGDRAVVKLLETQEPDLEKVDKAERDQVKNSLVFGQSDAEFEAMQEALRELGDVYLNPEVFK